MDIVKAVVIRAAGINCDMETEYALVKAGAEVERIHINRLIEQPETLDGFSIMVFPGGFSYGDDVAAGKILANQVVHHLRERVMSFIEAGKLVLGICNGFQVLVKSGILPGVNEGGAFDNSFSITSNDRGRFDDRWVYLEPVSERCVFLDKGRRIYLPIAHGEGKVVCSEAGRLEKAVSESYIAFKYVDQDGNDAGFPYNPNGSVHSIAGFTDKTGRVLGLMPHPERHIESWHHPRWTRGDLPEQPDGMSIFDNAVRYVRENL